MLRLWAASAESMRRFRPRRIFSWLFVSRESRKAMFGRRCGSGARW